MVTEGDTGYHLRVTATYTDAAGTDMAMEYSPATMMVTAMMTVPMFDSETATREVAENTEARMEIGDPVTGTDADGDTLIYALGGTDAASFYIDPETGQLKTLAALDYETKSHLLRHGLGHRPRQRKRHDHGDHHRHQRGRAG